ncbi:MAG: hypothetical protein KBG09_04200 [Syntrophobacterales bacterium]|nr:hypothetical protein [Syntrophobacterales bacterium]
MDEANEQLEAAYEEIVDVLATRLKIVSDVCNRQRREAASLKERMANVREAMDELRQLVFTMDLEADERDLIENIMARISLAAQI